MYLSTHLLQNQKECLARTGRFLLLLEKKNEAKRRGGLSLCDFTCRLQ